MFLAGQINYVQSKGVVTPRGKYSSSHAICLVFQRLCATSEARQCSCEYTALRESHQPFGGRRSLRCPCLCAKSIPHRAASHAAASDAKALSRSSSYVASLQYTARILEIEFADVEELINRDFGVIEVSP